MMLLLAAGLAAGSDRAAHADPDALWKIVHGACVPDQEQHGAPAPCTEVDLAQGEAHGTAILKDKRGKTQFLLIPTARIAGMESPDILQPDAPNYFEAAWQARRLVDQAAGRPLRREDLALAINSVAGRTQNQLHIHIDCIRRDIRGQLRGMLARIGDGWRVLPQRLAGHRYRALWIAGDDLGAANPFRLLAASLPDTAAEMGRHTLVLVGATRHGAPGFVLLDGEASAFSAALSPRLKLGSGSGEELEDHACRLAGAPHV